VDVSLSHPRAPRRGHDGSLRGRAVSGLRSRRRLTGRR
jgi:hypothetical protein